MRRLPPLKPVLMLGLAVGSVELPFLVVCVLVQCFRECAHCRHEWLSWPILAGVGPWYTSLRLGLLPRNLSLLEVRWGWGVFTTCLIGLVFAVSCRSTLWRQVLAGSLILSAALAALAFGIIAA